MCVIGYAIVGLSLLLFVQAKNVFPQLLLARLFFSVGGSATATMVTAILPSMITPQETTSIISPSRNPMPISGHTVSPSVSSELTITPVRFHHQASRSSIPPGQSVHHTSPTRLAGFVGLFTGFGALLALTLFLPLPAIFQKSGVRPGSAVANSYYVVGAVSLMVSVICFFGLRNLPGEKDKGWRNFKRVRNTTGFESRHIGSSFTLLLEAVKLGFIYPQLGLGYLGGFVARASSVGISLFIPLFVNAYFSKSGLCNEPSHETENIKAHCREAYILAAKLTGVSQLVALLFAPVFGYLADKQRPFNIPLLVGALVGILGYLGMSLLKGPETGGPNGSVWIFPIVAMLGISQIGAIVCSLGLVGHGVLGLDATASSRQSGNIDDGATHAGYESHRRNKVTSSDSVFFSGPIESTARDAGETTRLLGDTSADHKSYTHVKGSIAGVYSLAGGAGILLLTKLGGLAFDDISPVAPFYLLGLFNSLLLIVGVACGISTMTHGQ